LSIAPKCRSRPRGDNIVRILSRDDTTKYLAAKLNATICRKVRAVAHRGALRRPTAEAGRSIASLLTQKVAVEDQKLALEALRRNLGSFMERVEGRPTVKKRRHAEPGERSLADDPCADRDASLTDFSAAVVQLIPNSMQGTGPSRGD